MNIEVEKQEELYIMRIRSKRIDTFKASEVYFGDQAAFTL